MAVSPEYDFSQSVLYSMCEMIIASVEEELSDFTAYRPLITQPYLDALRLELLAAATLPGEAQRNATIQIAGVQLTNIHKPDALDRWQDLKRYITTGFPKIEVDIRLNEAGQSRYSSAYDNDWNEVVSLMLEGRTFITANSATLLAGGNMPAGFQATYNTAAANVTAKINQFLQLRDNKTQKTDQKTIANNTVWNKVRNMALDGQRLFKDNQAKKDQFIIDRLEEILSGPGISGIRVFVKDAVTELPIAGATGTIVLTDKTEVSDADGRIIINQASGSYTFRITAPGYQPKDTPIEIPVGHLLTETILLLPE